MLRRHWTLFLAFLPLLGWWTYGLFDLDEGFYAAIAAEMNRRGEWITPFYNGHPWFEKPILIYWLLKPSLWIFGDAIGPRVPSILTTAALYVLCAWFAKRRLSERAARWTPIVLGTSLLVVGAGRMVLTDPPLDLALAGAFLFFWESLVGDRRWRVASAACLGLAVLAKGPVAGALFIPVLGWIYGKHPALRPAFRGWWGVGTVVFALVVASWYLPCYLQNREHFVQEFIVEQNLGRFRGGDKAHTVPLVPLGWAVYPALLIVGFAPWWWFLPRAWRSGGDPVLDYLKAWAVVILAFFTISSAKLPHYILPAIPPLALLVATILPSVEALRKRVVAGVVATAVFANLAFLGYYYGFAPLRVAGFHAEVHRLARYVRDHARPSDVVAVYSLTKVTDAAGKAKLEQFGRKVGMHVEETSHPSLLLYLDRDVLEARDDEWAKILASPRPVWIITRWNRVGEVERRLAGNRLRAIEPFPSTFYKLYRFDPAGTLNP